MFRLTLALCSVFAVLYAGYWVVGWISLPKGIEAWAEERRDEGWQVEWSDLNVVGFPSRFDTTLTEPLISDPQTGWAWQAPFFQLLALSYKPNHLIAVWPGAHQLATPTARYQISHTEAQASLVFSNGTDLRIERANLVVDDLEITQAQSRQAQSSQASDSLRFAIRPNAATDLSYDVGLTVAGFSPSSATLRQLDPAGVLPTSVETLHLQATVGFDAPWDRFALEDQRPQPTSLKLGTAQATWGGLDLRIAADLDIDTFGQASGEITVQATNWREIVTLSTNAGVIPDSFVPLLEGALSSLAELSGPPNTLDVPITVSQGRLRLGLIPLGTLPPLQLR